MENQWMTDFQQTIHDAYDSAPAATQGLIDNVVSRFPCIQHKVQITPKQLRDLLAYLCNE